MKSIIAAEEEALEIKLLAQKEAQAAIEEAEKTGKEKVAATLASAGEEITHLKRLADQKAAGQAVELASTTANRQATIRARAERRLDETAQMIVERIQNS